MKLVICIEPQEQMVALVTSALSNQVLWRKHDSSTRLCYGHPTFRLVKSKIYVTNKYAIAIDQFCGLQQVNLESSNVLKQQVDQLATEDILERFHRGWYDFTPVLNIAEDFFRCIASKERCADCHLVKDATQWPPVHFDWVPTWFAWRE